MSKSTFCVLMALVLGCGSDAKTAATPPTDVGATDTVDVTVAPDLGAPDVPDIQDTAIEDVPDVPDIEEIAEDVGPADVPPPPPPPTIAGGVMVRVNWVDVEKPPLCIKLQPDQPCTDANSLINAYVGSHIEGGTQPMDIIGQFKPFGFEAGMDWDMFFGRGTCLRDDKGVIHWCTFDGTPTFFEDTTLQAPGACTVFDAPAACYTTDNSTPLTIDLAGVPLSFQDAFTAGQFAFNDKGAPTGVPVAYVQGFMKQTVAETTFINIPPLGDISLASLLDPADMIETDGEMGWFWKVNYTAIEVTQKPE